MNQCYPCRSSKDNVILTLSSNQTLIGSELLTYDLSLVCKDNGLEYLIGITVTMYWACQTSNQ